MQSSRPSVILEAQQALEQKEKEYEARVQSFEAERLEHQRRHREMEREMQSQNAKMEERIAQEKEKRVEHTKTWPSDESRSASSHADGLHGRRRTSSRHARCVL